MIGIIGRNLLKLRDCEAPSCNGPSARLRDFAPQPTIRPRKAGSIAPPRQVASNLKRRLVVLLCRRVQARSPVYLCQSLDSRSGSRPSQEIRVPYQVSATREIRKIAAQTTRTMLEIQCRIRLLAQRANAWPSRAQSGRRGQTTSPAASSGYERDCRSPMRRPSVPPPDEVKDPHSQLFAKPILSCL
jgi:hypothetical protein